LSTIPHFVSCGFGRERELDTNKLFNDAGLVVDLRSKNIGTMRGRPGVPGVMRVGSNIGE
jgi:hypothetical protein